MKPIYEEIETAFGNKSIKRTDKDGSIWWIPLDKANSDYQRYLEYLAENPDEMLKQQSAE